MNEVKLKVRQTGVSEEAPTPGEPAMTAGH